MRKIPTLFERDWDGDRSRVLDRVVPGCEWVAAGEGVATRKYDGTCLLVDVDLNLWKRREVKVGKPAPDGFDAFEADDDGNVVGWLPVGGGPEDALALATFEELLYAAAARSWPHSNAQPGTYELVGPKINKNPEGYDTHRMIRHADAEKRLDAPRDFAGLAAWFARLEAQGALIEGVVWHHPDGRMAKVKARDFGVRRATTRNPNEGER